MLTATVTVHHPQLQAMTGATESTTEEKEGPSPIAPEPKELAWTAGAFVVFAVLMRYVLYPRLRKGMDARYNAIRAEHEGADATRESARVEVATYEAELAVVKAEAAAKVEEARRVLEAGAPTGSPSERRHRCRPRRVRRKRSGRERSEQDRVGGPDVASGRRWRRKRQIRRGQRVVADVMSVEFPMNVLVARHPIVSEGHNDSEGITTLAAVARALRDHLGACLVELHVLYKMAGPFVKKGMPPARSGFKKSSTARSDSQAAEAEAKPFAAPRRHRCRRQRMRPKRHAGEALLVDGGPGPGRDRRVQARAAATSRPRRTVDRRVRSDRRFVGRRRSRCRESTRRHSQQ